MATKTRYRLLRGLHQSKDEEGKSKTYNARDPKNNIVESEIDLEQRFGADKYQNIDRLTNSPGADALQRRIKELEAENAKLKKRSAPVGETGTLQDLEDPKPTKESDLDDFEQGSPDDPYNLKELDVKGLRKYAREMEIDLGTATKKDELINVIQSALDAR